jgi:2,4-dienoyl-CoA reductase-like NADH-dependent reductase (Old Yellow Enzyme family)
MILLCDDEHIAGLKKLVDTVRREGAKIAVQLNHAGRQTSSATTGAPLVAPSPIPCPVQKEMPLVSLGRTKIQPALLQIWISCAPLASGLLFAQHISRKGGAVKS